jgi:hypothetical protein
MRQWLEESGDGLFWRYQNLSGWLFRDWGGGHEIVAEAGGVGTKQFGDALGLGGAEDKARVMFFSDALRDFGVSVGASIRDFLTRK